MEQETDAKSAEKHLKRTALACGCAVTPPTAFVAPSQNVYYGFPRLYRRFAEFNRRVTSNRQTLRRRQEVMKFVFRVPNRILEFFS
ncbi:hypothetical protein AWC38_SpisGene19883 [Stylophora pistillata]|uniref:Uncharacterized protein n=1 Tax=Stylophora pistillata TaxID=50429 RepID=A0A2B4RE23_STYPI|nr:hypothetical protein AWC38_SpisGene19883 [Stylophora pistillata]